MYEPGYENEPNYKADEHASPTVPTVAILSETVVFYTAGK